MKINNRIKMRLRQVGTGPIQLSCLEPIQCFDVIRDHTLVKAGLPFEYTIFVDDLKQWERGEGLLSKDAAQFERIVKASSLANNMPLNLSGTAEIYFDNCPD